MTTTKKGKKLPRKLLNCFILLNCLPDLVPDLEPVLVEVGGLSIVGGQDRALYEAAAHEVVKVVAGLNLWEGDIFSLRWSK